MERDWREEEKKKAPVLEKIDEDLRTLDGHCTRQREDLKKGVKWQKQANDSFQSIIDHPTRLEEHNSWRQREFDKLQEKVYLLESQVLVKVASSYLFIALI